MAGARSRFYNGTEKGRAKLHVAKRAMKFEKEMADKIRDQLEKVHNLRWIAVCVNPTPYAA